jgi:hypothetical protein
MALLDNIPDITASTFNLKVVFILKNVKNIYAAGFSFELKVYASIEEEHGEESRL